jgi:hypothetical protein
MKSRWIPSLLVLSITSLVCLLALEATVRIVEPKNVFRENFERLDPVFHHRFVPNASGWSKSREFKVSFSINAIGLRDREISRNKAEGTKRVLMLGDSFTEGQGVEAKDAFPARVQALVDAAGLSTRWEVLNAGEQSYSPLLEYLLLEKQLIDLEPDLVILNLDLSDVWDDIQYTKRATFNASGKPVAVRAEPVTFDASGKPVDVHAEPETKLRPWYVEAIYSLEDFMKEHIRLYNFLRSRIAWRLMARLDASGDVRVDKYAMIRDGYHGDGSDWSLTFGYIERIRDLLTVRGVPLWLTVYPYGHQISPPRVERRKGRLELRAEPGLHHGAPEAGRGARPEQGHFRDQHDGRLSGALEEGVPALLRVRRPLPARRPCRRGRGDFPRAAALSAAGRSAHQNADLPRN